MAIIQISKLQQRSGNLVDLPQLDDAEFGWASDSKRLFIGKSTPNENIEVLTSYSNISFSQINGSIGNLNITAASAGQVLSYDGTNWINYTGTGLAGSGNLQLGNVSNVRIAGGAIGYVLQTDGQGNLSWTPKTTVTATIKGLSAATPVVMTVDANTPYTNATQVTISGATGAGNTIVNGLSFYVKVATNFPTTGNVSLYTDATLLTALVGTGIVYTANSGIAVSTISGSGTSAAGGASTSIQYNNGGIITGSANLTFDFTTNLFTVSGNANAGNINTSGVVTSSRVISNIATGTAPLTITSSTLVPNLYVARANVADFEVVTTRTTGTFYPTFVSGNTTANYSQSSNANLSFNVATGALAATLLTGTLTTVAQPNITSVGTLTSVDVTGIATVGDIQKTGTAGDTLSIFGAGNTNVNGAGGIIQVFAGDGNGTGTGGALSLNAGTANSSGNAAGGMTELRAGEGYGQGQGGTVGIYSGASANTYGATGGNITITGGTYDGAGGDMSITGGQAAGLNHIGGDITVIAGASTGTGTSGKILVQTATVGSTGNVVQTLSDRVIIDGTQMNVRFTTASSSTTTGALEVAGGVGVVGNVYAGAFYGAATGLTSIPGANVSGTVPLATTAGTVTTAAQPNITSVGTLTALSVTGNISGANITGTHYGAATGLTSIPGANVTGTVPLATSATTAGTVTTAAQPNITSTGTLTALVVTGNITSGNANLGNLLIANFHQGTLTTAAQPNITSVGTLTSLSVNGTTTGVAFTANTGVFTGNGSGLTSITGANVTGTVANATYAVSSGTAGTVTTAAQPNITSVGTLSSLTTTIITSGANTTAGTITGNWGLSAGSKLTATYADLAEYYTADQFYAPGTVLAFGGSQEVTIAKDSTNKVAGVVSTNPAYVMNSLCKGEFIVALALQGRVPCKVRGTIAKGDMLVSGGDGYARPATTPLMGTVIGKALENFSGSDGIIEVAVGRL